MKRLARKAVLATAITCYVAMVTGTTLHLHLLSRQHPEEHDAAHCSICQQSLIAPGKFITEPELIILDHSPRTDTVEFQSESYFIPCHFGPSSPRAPPPTHQQLSRVNSSTTDFSQPACALES